MVYDPKSCDNAIDRNAYKTIWFPLKEIVEMDSAPQDKDAGVPGKFRTVNLGEMIQRVHDEARLQLARGS